ncbi:MAG: ABC transporter ATP-binding protein [Bacteroidetes bacterium]|nr:ABC transporter ATP-binding protein [Bacteroidota bacterium]MDA0873750.1 ABC transporter ATP-binding protein [Bacteroidota bacterium]
MSLIEASRLRVTLGGSLILDDISFTVQPGTWRGLLGPNGSGKTTLLRCVAGLLEHTGSLLMEGRPVASWTRRALARRLAFVRQSNAIAFDFRVLDLVLLGRAPHKSLLSVYDHEDEHHALDALRRVDLDGLAERSFHSLSGGEQQRVFLAQALVQEADILILDEPTTYLDVHHQYEFLGHVRTLVDAGKTVIGAFHDLELAARYSDRLLVLDRGRMAAEGTPGEVLTKDLLAGVFRMDAEVGTAPDGHLRIAFAAPLP